jgi:hypothetical protein
MDNITLSAAAAHLVVAYKRVTAEYLKRMPLDVQVLKTLGGTTSYSVLVSEANLEGRLRISCEFSETSIYGVSGNVAFRTMHDLGHIAHGLTFDPLDEIALALHQWQFIAPHLPHEWRDVCHNVYLADTVQQTLYDARHGIFPVDQRAFVLSCVPDLY